MDWIDLVDFLSSFSISEFHIFVFYMTWSFHFNFSSYSSIFTSCFSSSRWRSYLRPNSSNELRIIFSRYYQLIWWFVSVICFFLVLVLRVASVTGIWSISYSVLFNFGIVCSFIHYLRHGIVLCIFCIPFDLLNNTNFVVPFAFLII